MKSFLFALALIPLGSLSQPGLEVHYSVNHPLNASRTFFGGGIGGNILFRDTRVFNFKIGIEANYFHTWDQGIYAGQMQSRKNLHYQYVVLSFPVFARFTFGDRFKVFLEMGAYAGICVGGKVQFTGTSYSTSPNQPSTTYEGEDSYSTGLSITPGIGLGARFPLSERLDLFLKPEFAVVRSRLGSQMDGYGSGYGGSYDFNQSYLYVRFCLGVHLKPKKK